VAVINGDRSTDVIYLKARMGDKVSLSAKGTGDPDGNSVNLYWWIYEEAGNARGALLTDESGINTVVDLSNVSRRGTLHIILQVNDNGIPSLYSYRRAVIEIQ
jgi:hypothetical protein